MRYPHAIWEGAATQDFSRQGIDPDFVVMHVAQGSASGTTAWFHNPYSILSAHFMSPKEGPVLQYVDTDEEAYAEMSFNGLAISIEHEGFSGEHLTENQLANDARLLVWINRVHRVPLKWRNDAYGRGGVTSHGDLGAAGGDHLSCPGIPIDNDVRNLLNKLQRPLLRFTFSG